MENFITVDPVAKSREQLSQTVASMAELGLAAPPVVIGRHRKPEAVIISFAMFQQVHQAIDRVMAAHVAAQRLETEEPTEEAFSELCRTMGLDPGKAAAQRALDEANGFDPVMPDE